MYVCSQTNVVFWCRTYYITKTLVEPNNSICKCPIRRSAAFLQHCIIWKSFQIMSLIPKKEARIKGLFQSLWYAARHLLCSTFEGGIVRFQSQTCSTLGHDEKPLIENRLLPPFPCCRKKRCVRFRKKFQDFFVMLKMPPSQPCQWQIKRCLS